MLADSFRVRAVMETRQSPGNRAADPDLERLLKERLLRSEGQEDAHCFIRSPEVATGSPMDPGSDAPTPCKAQPSSALAGDMAAGSPHYSLETPPSSPQRKPARLFPEEDLSTEEGDKPASSDEAENEIYDWQFDIMNHLPHEKAVSLVNLLKDSQRDKAQAQEFQRQSSWETKQLGKKACEARESKFEASSQELPDAASSSSSTSPVHPTTGLLSWRWHLLACAALVAAFFAGCVHRPLIDHLWLPERGGQRPSVLSPDIIEHATEQDEGAHQEQLSAAPADSGSQAARQDAPTADELPPRVRVESVEEADTESAGQSSDTALPSSVQTREDPAAPTDAASSAEGSLGLQPKVAEAGAVVVASAADALVSPPAAQEGHLVLPPAPPKVMSADLLGQPILLCQHPALAQDTMAPFDATAELTTALSYFPFVKKAYRLGRVVLKKADLHGARPVLTASINFGNDGRMPWLDSTRLLLVVGPDMGLSILPLETVVQPGAHVELSLQFEMPASEPAGTVLRSGWVLESNNEPFGPLLLLEVQVV